MKTVIENIAIEFDDCNKKCYTVTRRSLMSNDELLLGTITVQDDGLYCANSLNHPHTPVLWQNFERALAFLISPRGMT